MSDQMEIPIGWQIIQLMRKSAPILVHDLSDSEAARAELLEKIKGDRKWKEALFKVAAERLDQVIFGKGRGKSCVADRQREVVWLMEVAMEAYPDLRNGFRLPGDHPDTPVMPGVAA